MKYEIKPVESVPASRTGDTSRKPFYEAILNDFVKSGNRYATLEIDGVKSVSSGHRLRRLAKEKKIKVTAVVRGKTVYLINFAVPEEI